MAKSISKFPLTRKPRDRAAFFQEIAGNPTASYGRVMMMHNRHTPEEIPDEILETDRVVRNADKAIRKIDTALRHSMTRKGLDPRLRVEMQYLLEALRTVRVSLSVLDATVEVALKDAASRPLSSC